MTWLHLCNWHSCEGAWESGCSYTERLTHQHGLWADGTLAVKTGFVGAEPHFPTQSHLSWSQEAPQTWRHQKPGRSPRVCHVHSIPALSEENKPMNQELTNSRYLWCCSGFMGPGKMEFIPTLLWPGFHALLIAFSTSYFFLAFIVRFNEQRVENTVASWARSLNSNYDAFLVQFSAASIRHLQCDRLCARKVEGSRQHFCLKLGMRGKEGKTELRVVMEMSIKLSRVQWRDPFHLWTELGKPPGVDGILFLYF